MVDPEEMRKGNLQVAMEALEILKRYPKQQLISIRKALNNWGWHPLLGPKPEGWEKMPRYRKPWMPEDTITRKDYIAKYMILLDLLGITHWVAYGL